MYRFIFFGIAMSLLVAEASAQTEVSAHPKTPIHFAFVELQANGNLLVQQTQFVQEQQEQEYTVMIPVNETKTKEEGGRTVTYTVTRHVQETRTRTVTVMKAVPISNELPKGSFVLYSMGGNKVALSPLQGQPAVLVGQGQKLDTWYRKIVRPNAVVVTIKSPETLPQAPAATPAPTPADG